MADEETPEQTPAEPEKSEDPWNKLKEVVRGVIGEELGKWESKRTSGKSSTTSKEEAPEKKEKTLLEKLISG